MGLAPARIPIGSCDVLSEAGLQTKVAIPTRLQTTDAAPFLRANERVRRGDREEVRESDQSDVYAESDEISAC